MPDTINTIEWDMMDKRKFFPLSMLSSFTVRCCLYPLTVIKTRLQVQRHDQMYKGKYLYEPLPPPCNVEYTLPIVQVSERFMVIVTLKIFSYLL